MGHVQNEKQMQKIGNKKDTIESGVRTHALRGGTAPEAAALDRSAISTGYLVFGTLAVKGLSWNIYNRQTKVPGEEAVYIIVQ